MRISDWSSDVCSADLVVISHADQLADMAPRFARSLSAQFDVDELAGRLSPVLLEDQTVALFALAEHVGGDQADALARRVVQRGYRLANPARYARKSVVWGKRVSVRVVFVCRGF